MPRKKSARHHKSTKYAEIPLLAISTGVIFFVLQLLFLMYVADITTSLAGLFTALWLGGGLLFAVGVVAMVRDSRWAPLLVAGPAVTFSLFCIIALLAGLGTSFTSFLVGA